MSEYLYYTRDGNVTGDKPKVLISMHPADRPLYFDILSDNILKSFDCTVCCSAFPNDNKPISLNDVSLIIIAVTEKYITWKNSGFISEFIHLSSKGVNVLPIMYQKGINNLFNTRCGKLQYIDFTSDESRLRYLPKLSLHINTVLGTADVSASDTCNKLAFISYRKKDILYLKRLINVIEKGNISGVSLWYDSNLTPGEDYKLRILDVINDCDLYILIVTPSLLEKDNYVMRVEYPLAVKLGKSILAIEMENTDKSLLKKLYPQLPKCITEKHTDALFAKLRSLN